MNIAPSYTRVIRQNLVFNLGAYMRKDIYRYYPSDNPFADLGPLQRETIGQNRSLANLGSHGEISYVQGIHSVKAGAVYEQTLLGESDSLGIVDPAMNVPGSPTFNLVLLPYDLTRGGCQYHFLGHTDVKELAFYVEDQIKRGRWLFNIGIRGDLYNGFSVAQQGEPRVGLPTASSQRVPYSAPLMRG